ncbi:MAG: hypothetical protein K6D94_03985 [Clostridiales bacterium]|nr:hypothetical protein [Clostridiales bacterium]
METLVGGTGTESFTWDPSWLKALNELAGYEAYENTSKANNSATWYFIPAN